MHEALAEVVVTLGAGNESVGWLWLGLIGGTALGVLVLTVGRAAFRMIRDFARWRREVLERLEWELTQEEERRRAEESEAIKELLARADQERTRSAECARPVERKGPNQRSGTSSSATALAPAPSLADSRTGAEMWGGAAGAEANMRRRVKLPPLPLPLLPLAPRGVAAESDDRHGTPAARGGADARRTRPRVPASMPESSLPEELRRREAPPNEVLSPVGEDPDRTTVWRVDLKAIRARFAHEGGSG